MTPTPAAPSGEQITPAMIAAGEAALDAGGHCDCGNPTKADAETVYKAMRAAVSQAAPEQATPIIGATAWYHRGMVNFDEADALKALDDGKGTPINLYLAAPSGAPKQEIAAQTGIKTTLALPIRITNWEGGDCLFDANNKPLYINAPNEPYQEAIREIVRLVNASAACSCPSGDGSLRWPCPKHGKGDLAAASTVQSAPVLPENLAFYKNAHTSISGKLSAVWEGIRETVEKYSGKPCEGEPFDRLDELLARLAAAQSTPVQVEGQQEQTDDEFDRNAARLTNEMGLGGGTLNPNATSVTDLFMEDLPSCDSALHAEPGSRVDAGFGDWISVTERMPEDRQAVAFVVQSEGSSWGYLNRRVLGGNYDETWGGFSVPGLTIGASHWMPLPPAPEESNTAGSARQGGEHAPEIVQALALPVAAAPEQKP